MSPNIAKQLIAKGFNIIVEEDAGVNSSYKNSDYINEGAGVEKRGVVFKDSDILIKINPFHSKKFTMFKLMFLFTLLNIVLR